MPTTQVMILGTYHMANPGLDLVKTTIRDTLGPERQSEIAAVVARLAEFAPTKICIEATPGNTRVHERYRDPNVEFTANEIEQIGFRLGHQLGHEQLYPVDFHLDWDGAGLFEFAQTHCIDGWLAKANRLIAEIGPMMEAWDHDYSVGEILAIHNSEPMIRLSHSLYLDAVEVTDGVAFPGVDTTVNWYARNLRIWANIRRVVTAGDRVLVLYGAGHVKYLRDFVRESSDFEEVPASNFLPESPVSVSV